MSNVLEGKTAIITGAGSGMGLATARLFHQQGANIVLADFSGAQEKTAVELGDRTVPIQADISNAADAKAMVSLAISEFGGLDILCNIAGANAPMVQHHEALESDFDKMINVNLRGAFLTMKFAIPAMLERGAGSIVNVASAAALMGTPLYGGYSAAKTGLLGLTRTIALEYAEQNIRANSICPGPIRTPMMEEALAENPAAADYLINMVPARRVGTAEEVAHAVLFLASEQSSYITGVALPIDGGQTAA